MPTSITDSAGNSWHLYQLPDLSAPEPSDSISFTTLDNEMSQGHRSTLLLGSNTGVREWTLKFPTLAGATVIAAAVTDPYGATVSRETYIRNLVKYNLTTGKPFAYQWPPETGQYYLVDVVPNPLSMARVKGANIYASEITLRQRRLSGVTVFDVSKIPTLQAGFGYDWFNETSHGSGIWTNKAPGGNLTASGDVVFSSNAQNGHNTVRFSGSSSTGKLTTSGFNSAIYDLFIVMKMREATFSNNAGIFSGGGFSVLQGTSGGTIFQNLGSGSHYYNGVLKIATNRTAPMNTWGIVQLRASGDDVTQIGQNQAVAGTFAKMDIGEIVSSVARMTREEERGLTEHLAIKWGITL